MRHDPRGRRETGPGAPPPPGPVSVTRTDESSESSSAVLRNGAPGADPQGTPAAGQDGVPVPPQLTGAVEAVFGDRLPLAVAYAELLATEGVLRGLIGPREAPRIWERHLLNCAVLAELIPAGQVVLDVGSGAGLPGVVLAIARPDLSVGLIEPLARRADFLHEVVERLGLAESVVACRARAEELAAAGPVIGDRPADVVTARAVAPLDRLAGWCLPLAAIGGRLLAMKGSSADAEVTEHRDHISRLGGGTPVVRQCGVGLVDPPTTVVEVVRERAVEGRAKGSRTAARRSGAAGSAKRGSAARGGAAGGSQGWRTGKRGGQPRRPGAN